MIKKFNNFILESFDLSFIDDFIDNDPRSGEYTQSILDELDMMYKSDFINTVLGKDDRTKDLSMEDKEIMWKYYVANMLKSVTNKI